MSSELPTLSADEVVRALQRVGFHPLPGRGKGSHIVLHHGQSGKILTVPSHGDLRRGTLRALIRQADLSVEQFRALL
jgi:predicted RNA binding protein YcfA (HicA-like mRNA interferase family)